MFIEQAIVNLFLKLKVLGSMRRGLRENVDEVVARTS